MSEPSTPRASPEFHRELVAPESDIDDLGHVSNVAYVRWIQEIAIAHSTAVGYDHAAYLGLGGVWVVRRHDIEYLAPCYAGEAVRLATWIEDWRGVSSTRRTRITRTTDARELVRGATLWVWVDAGNGRPRRIPAPMRDAFLREAT